MRLTGSAVEPPVLEGTARTALDGRGDVVRIIGIRVDPRSTPEVEHVGLAQQALANVDAPVEVEGALIIAPIGLAHPGSR